jgi:hypothetical protein
MRSIIFGSLVASGLVFLNIVAASALPVGNALQTAPGVESTVQQVQGRRHCDELRRACLNKDKLGERGEGNCQRYRAQCRSFGYGNDRSDERPSRRSHD